MSALGDSEDEKMKQELLGFLDGNSPPAATKPATQPVRKQSVCTELMMVRNNNRFMNSVLMKDLSLEMDDMDNRDVGLNINAINYIYTDINTGHLASLPESKRERDILRHNYVQEYKRDLNSPDPSYDIPKEGFFRRLFDRWFRDKEAL